MNGRPTVKLRWQTPPALCGRDLGKRYEMTGSLSTACKNGHSNNSCYIGEAGARMSSPDFL